MQIYLIFIRWDINLHEMGFIVCTSVGIQRIWIIPWEHHEIKVCFQIPRST